MPDKREWLEILRRRVDDECRRMEGTQQRAQAGAVHVETRQEDPKDTRAIEAGYLARGLAERAEGLRETRDKLATLVPRRFDEHTPIGLGALVTLEGDAGERLQVLLVPVAGGETVTAQGEELKAVSPASPLGRALVGRRLDDEVEVATPAGVTRWQVAALE